MRIQHNIMAMNAYRNYNTNTSALSKNLEKLSSGYKINRAGDDAAGLAISEKMRAQITGLNAAQKNVKDGISLVKTAEGAMQEIQDMLNRMDYLATQSANGTYDNEVDRANLQKEVDQLKSEINRIADSSNFNGIKLLDGSLAQSTAAADEAVTKLSNVTVTHIADHATAPDPQKGKYTLDLSEVSVTTNAQKAKVTGATTAAATVVPGTDDVITTTTDTDGNETTSTATAASKATITFNLAGMTVTAPTDGSATTAKIKLGDNEYEIDVTADMTETEVADAVRAKITEDATFSDADFELDAAASTGTNIVFKAKNPGALTPTAVSSSITPGEAADDAVNKVEVAFASGESWSYDLAAGKSMTGAQWAEKFMEDTKGKVQIGGVDFNVSNSNGVLTFEMAETPTEDFTANLTTTLKVTDATGANTLAQAGGATANKNDNGSATIQGEGIGVHVVQEAVAPGAQAQAQGKFDLGTVFADGVKDGDALKIGNDTYIFAVGKDSDFKDYGGDAKIVDLTDQIAGTPAATLNTTAAKRLSAVAVGNKMFDVATTNAGSEIRLSERKNSGIDYDVNRLQGTLMDNLNDANDAAWNGLVQSGKGVIGAKSASTTGGLQLQIGDTSDSFNQLKVVVGDMHTKALGIADLDISNPESAASAIETIKAAINQVSSVRGDLGATQNRLEHTANNLSVMAENIQDAESTIRDTDIAEEMMAYTKNNILVQSAQAMLAQANAVPQGVLQLLG